VHLNEDGPKGSELALAHAPHYVREVAGHLEAGRQLPDGGLARFAGHSDRCMRSQAVWARRQSSTHHTGREKSQPALKPRHGRATAVSTIFEFSHGATGRATDPPCDDEFDVQALQLSIPALPVTELEPAPVRTQPN